MRYSVRFHSLEYGNSSDGIFDSRQEALDYVSKTYGNFIIDTVDDYSTDLLPKDGEFFNKDLINSISIVSRDSGGE